MKTELFYDSTGATAVILEFITEKDWQTAKTILFKLFFSYNNEQLQ